MIKWLRDNLRKRAGSKFFKRGENQIGHCLHPCGWNWPELHPGIMIMQNWLIYLAFHHGTKIMQFLNGIKIKPRFIVCKYCKIVWTTDYNYNYELVNFLLQTSTFFFMSMSSTQYLLKSYLVKIQSIMKSRFYIKVQFICQDRLDLWKATAYDRRYSTFLLIY